MSELAVTDQGTLPHPAEQRRVGAWSRSSARLCVLTAALTCIGLLMVASVNTGTAFLQDLAKPAATRGIGLAVFAVGALVPYRTWRRHSLLALLGTFALLAAVLAWGLRINGARRWLDVGLPVTFQPSEFAKIGLLIWIAAWCERNVQDMRHFVRGFFLPLAVVGGAGLLILAEPDFGTTVLIGAVCTAVLLVMGTRLIFVLLAGAAALPITQYLVMGTPYRRARIMAFLDPWADPSGTGYQLIQSKIAIGSGGIWGLGPGASAQKVGFLPGTDNDFVFSILAEELGFVGSTVVILLFLALVLEGINVVRRAPDPFAFALSLGLTLLLGLQAALHIAVVTGSVPTKGLSLPFISAGGSSLLASMLAAGILVNIARAEENPGPRVAGIPDDAPEYERKVDEALERLGSSCAEKIDSLLHPTESEESP
jgi:cell division protein FtsW